MLNNTKQFKTAVVIGKFYPPHKGHSLLIERALQDAEAVAVIVCNRAGEKIPGELRAAWIGESHPRAKVMVIEDIYPEDDSVLWAKKTVEWLGFVPDAVFTSEEYGDAYAKAMGSKHIPVDKTRKLVPISGTEIRKNPLEYFEFLAPQVRAYFVPRICVLGAESTGTTTMAKALAEHYQTAWVPEYGRMYWEGKMTGKDGDAWRTEEFVHIASMQSQMEDELARSANKLLICDTNAFATGVWHERYMERRADEVEAIARGRAYDVYLLTNVDIPFVQDGTRDGEHIRYWMHRLFETRLKEVGVRYVALSGPHEKRLKEAIGLIDEILKAPHVI